jgi:hypothetical protein
MYGYPADPLVTQHVVTVAPTEEPLTLDEGKLVAGVDWPSGDPREPLMSGWIAAARDQVERDTGLPLLTQTIDLSIKGVPGPYSGPWWGVPVSPWYVPVYPWYNPTVATIVLVRAPGRLQAVSSAEYLDDAGQSQTIDPSTYVVDLTRGTIWPLSGSWPNTALRIQYVAGWASAAVLKPAVPLLIHALGLLVAHYATLGRDIAVLERGSLLTIPQGYVDAIAAYAQVAVA